MSFNFHRFFGAKIKIQVGQYYEFLDKNLELDISVRHRLYNHNDLDLRCGFLIKTL